MINADNNINPLLVRIRDAIKAFVDNDISINQAREIYSDLLSEYNSIEDKLNTDKHGSYIKGLFYHHTTSNFAKLTVLFQKKDSNWQHGIFAGNEELIPVVKSIIETNKHLIKNDSMTALPVSSEDRLNYIILARYLHPTDQDKIVATISSSSYFSGEDFEYFCDLIRSYALSGQRQGKRISLDLYSEIKGELKTIIPSFIDAGMKITAHLFYFDPFTEIFSHMGLNTVSAISEKIYNTLQNSFSLDSVVYILSLSKFLVISPSAEPEKTHKAAGKSRINFIYDGILLNYRSRSIEIKDMSDFYNLRNQFTREAV